MNRGVTLLLITRWMQTWMFNTGNKMASINEFGEITRSSAPQRIENDALWREYQQLEYEIFSHNDKSPEKLARFQELEKQLGITQQKKNAFINAKNKLRAQAEQTLSVTQILAMGKEQQNE